MKTINLSDIRYSNESMFVRETKRGYQYFLRYTYGREFYSTSRQDFARCLPDGININEIAPKKGKVPA